MSEEESFVEEITDLTDSNVITKHKEAAKIANNAIQGLMKFIKPGVQVVKACSFGDTVILKQCELIFKSKSIEKGIAFPTCISVNQVVCHYSPLDSEATENVFKLGDIIKIDLGVHIDGYIAVSAHTFILNEDNSSPLPISGKKADVFKAAFTCLEGCTKLMKPGASNQDITSFISKVCACFEVNQVQGVLMHQLKRYVIDGNEVILNKQDLESKVDTFQFEQNKVYTLDIVLSSGSGKPVQTDFRTTVFKRVIDQNYNLKMKASRAVFSQMQSTYPFTLRGLVKEEKTARLGIVECLKHSLVHDYPVLVEKGEDVVLVHLKATVLLLPSGTVRITSSNGLKAIEDWVQSDKELTEEIKEVLSRSSKNKKKK